MDHDHMDPMSMSPPATKKRYTSMSFFWGNKAEVLFSGWPGDRGGMYALALIVVILLAVLTEMASNHRLDRCTQGRGLMQTGLHVLRVGLMYLLMLAVMSFNGGVFIAACVGHALGFLLFRSSLFGKQLQPQEETWACGNGNGAKYRDLPAMSC